MTKKNIEKKNSIFLNTYPSYNRIPRLSECPITQLEDNNIFRIKVIVCV